MNIFNFEVSEAIAGLINFFAYGLFFGFVVLGFIRFILLTIFERKEA